MVLSPHFETVIPLVRQAQNIVVSRRVPDSLKLVRQISNLRNCSNDIRSSASYSGALCTTGTKTGSLLSHGLRNSLTHIRTVCGRENCADPCDLPICSPENLEKSDCMIKRKKIKAEKKTQTVYDVYWNRPECCNDECMSTFPRFDDLYYRESDKENRVYTQTWADCPPMVIVPRPVCCTDKLNLPPLCKRPAKLRPKTACGAEDLPCPPELEGKCPKIRMPCCRAARTTPCRRETFPSDCKKFTAPSPSFSECRKPEFRRLRITECWCLAAPSMCQVWAEWRRLQLIRRTSS